LFGKSGKRVEFAFGTEAGGESAERVHGWGCGNRGSGIRAMPRGEVARRLAGGGNLSKSFGFERLEDLPLQDMAMRW
jgi:hypothetical protein